MVVDIWEECHGKKHITIIQEIAWRIAELQEKTSTRKLVDSLEEQKILEELLDPAKPIFLESQKNFHSLLSTPFRYPPLKNGSRFGKKTEPSLWYGSLSPKTAMTEKAYYLLAFINASSGDFGTIISPMTIFSINLKIEHGVYLNNEPFTNYQHYISSPTQYDASQLLGNKMRVSNVDGFIFNSARDSDAGINVGLFHQKSFSHQHPNAASFQTWQCYTTNDLVEFIQVGSIHDQSFVYHKNDFMINDQFPMPSIT